MVDHRSYSIISHAKWLKFCWNYANLRWIGMGKHMKILANSGTFFELQILQDLNCRISLVLIYFDQILPPLNMKCWTVEHLWKNILMKATWAIYIYIEAYIMWDKKHPWDLKFTVTTHPWRNTPPGGPTLMHTQRIAWSHYEGPTPGLSGGGRPGTWDKETEGLLLLWCYFYVMLILAKWGINWIFLFEKIYVEALWSFECLNQIIGEDTSSALHLAVHGGFQEVVEALLEAPGAQAFCEMRIAPLRQNSCRAVVWSCRRPKQTWTKRAQMDALRPMLLRRVSWRC